MNFISRAASYGKHYMHGANARGIKSKEEEEEEKIVDAFTFGFFLTISIKIMLRII